MTHELNWTIMSLPAGPLFRPILNCYPSLFLLLILGLGWTQSQGNGTMSASPIRVVEGSQLMRYGAPPPGDIESYDSGTSLRRQYKLEDFMWTGSGVGPIPSDQDGGLAWEDNGGGPPRLDSVDPILVTKTLVIFRTVMTTIYPVELTPALVPGTPSISSLPIPSESASLPYSPGLIEPTPTFSPYPGPSDSVIEILPTPTPSLPYDQRTSPAGEALPTPEPDTSASTNRLYWVKTVIKANESEALSNSTEFQSAMQKNLARVYASVFKRHLLSSLGVLERVENGSRREAGPRRRRRRSASEREREEIDLEWEFLRNGMTPAQLKSLAATTMNVSVSILNITRVGKLPQVRMDYIVCAEGKPVPAASAVQDMSLITKKEMEDEIGYVIINKAEALVANPAESGQISTGSTSPWLIVAITTICLMVILLVLLMFMVWKWKNNRLGDTRMSRPQSGIEGGVINPAFLGPPSPIERSGAHREDPITIAARQSTHSKSSRKSEKESYPSTSSGGTRSRRKSQQRALASELSTFLTEDGNALSPSSIKGSSGSRSGSGSLEEPTPTRVPSPRYREEKKRVSTSKRPKTLVPTRSPLASPMKRSPRRPASTVERRRQRRKTGIVVEGGEKESQRPVSASSRDKVSLGHLDVCEEALAQPVSEEAKRLMGRGTSKAESDRGSSSQSQPAPKAEGRRKSRLQFPETIDELSDTGLSRGQSSPFEQDREISESLETLAAVAGSPTKDAQVQTPTRRLKGSVKVRGKVKPKPKPRTFPGSRVSSESLLSTESEEIIEIHNIDESSSETNPLGKMRRRFHQFLDDAFNVIGKKEGDEEEGRSKSAKVSISHQVERKETSRPWTSSVIHEESVERSRPKSASLGPPRRAWTASTEPRRCHSAKSDSSVSTWRGREDSMISEEDPRDEPDLNSTTGTEDLSTSVPSFPGYPIYPDVPLPPDPRPGTSRARSLPRPPDPAIPLIQAIKEEIKRFEKVKLTETHFQQPRRSP